MKSLKQIWQTFAGTRVGQSGPINNWSFKQ